MRSTSKPQVTGNFLTCPGRDSNLGSDERLQEVGENACEHSAVGAALGLGILIANLA